MSSTCCIASDNKYRQLYGLLSLAKYWSLTLKHWFNHAPFAPKYFKPCAFQIIHKSPICSISTRWQYNNVYRWRKVIIQGPKNSLTSLGLQLIRENIYTLFSFLTFHFLKNHLTIPDRGSSESIERILWHLPKRWLVSFKLLLKLKKIYWNSISVPYKRIPLS